jgi:hypothetical protein
MLRWPYLGIDFSMDQYSCWETDGNQLQLVQNQYKELFPKVQKNQQIKDHLQTVVQSGDKEVVLEFLQ